MSSMKLNRFLISEHLSKALQFKTISYNKPEQFEYSEFNKFFIYLEVTYPNLHTRLKRTVVNNYSLLYEWTGKVKNARPIILTAHTDVVPVSPETENSWRNEAFSGAILDGYIWGRGAIDCKNCVIGICEAVEYLITSEFQPERTIFLAFGHDEEVGGLNGALHIAAYLKDQGIEAEFVLDEGGAVVEGVLPGLKKPAALIGTAEKGFVSLELTVKTEGGHSSTPPKETAIGILSRAVSKVEGHPFKTSLQGSVREMFKFLSPGMGFGYRLLFSNLWISEGLLKKSMESNPETAASIRTTTALTIFEAGIQDNVLPDSARAVVNFRILPGDSIDGVMERMKDIISDSRVHIEKTGHWSEPSPVSSTESNGFKVLQKTIRQVFPNSLACPYLVLGATNARHYLTVAKDVYRFEPLSIKADELQMNHGVNERISVDNFQKAVEFYAEFIQNA